MCKASSGDVWLVDLDRLLDLWIENYARVEETKRQLLPLKPVYYLAPAP